ncbi:hypothetical protein EDB86DRAFT_623408 [Lactarius hatsudake]|nr:hypothetical protein EDB86DRAFT_623408 [Lactarius hatsudake]
MFHYFSPLHHLHLKYCSVWSCRGVRPSARSDDSRAIAVLPSTHTRDMHIVPFWSGTEHHDFHHMAFVNNYSTSFHWWDRALGTENKYRAYHERIVSRY